MPPHNQTPTPIGNPDLLRLGDPDLDGRTPSCHVDQVQKTNPDRVPLKRLV